MDRSVGRRQAGVPPGSAPMAGWGIGTSRASTATAGTTAPATKLTWADQCSSAARPMGGPNAVPSAAARP